MNYLAHLYLSDDNPEITAGNFFGDHVKGLLDESLPDGIKKGISFHRFIDSYTDQHPVCARARALLFDDYRHFSGVLTDIFWDHYLARLWSEFQSESLEDYTMRSYAELEPYLKFFPPTATRMLAAMSKSNWLLHYQSIEGIAKSLAGLSHRVRFANPLLGAEEALIKYDAELLVLFWEFFPDLQQVCREYLSKGPSSSDKDE